MRFETLVPSGLVHRALEDTQFMGYDIPKVYCIVMAHITFHSTFLSLYFIVKLSHLYTPLQDTVAMPALAGLHADVNKWGDPHVFRPERFLDERGQLSLKKDYSLPFGAGMVTFVHVYICSII